MVMSRQSNLWFTFVFLSTIAAVLSYKYFDKVVPLVQLSITADRQQVIDDAVRVAAELQWDIDGYQTSVEFGSDGNLQSFIELEGGGKQAFVEMFQTGTYYPYQWEVRFFKEQEIVEMRVEFSPDGKRIGFAQKLSEKAEGQALSKEEAQIIVEQNIATWCPHFENYTLVEYDSEKQDTGRVDHTFVYERTDLTIGKGLYRFEAVVRGDVVTKLEPFVKVPDEFVRRYTEMRSANAVISMISQFFFKLLYLFIFCLLGLLYFYRRHYLLVKPAFLVAFVVAGLEFLSGFNDYPLWWCYYNTIQSSSNFMMTQFFNYFINFFAVLSVTFVTLLVAEAAGRFVYKHHAQFFKLLSWPALSSTELFKQVSIGYLWTPFEFGYVILFVYLTETYFSWWSPSSSLSDPNVIVSFFPWFGAISKSLRAGFGEEVMCRALPLAMTAFLTRNSKYKGWWFAAIFIVQALIFGGCHADYANQPSYARVIELIIPSFNFGFLYYRYGLIPGVICHFVYDAVLFALPVFASTLFWSKIMVVFLIGLPFWVVLGVLIYNKKLHELPAQYFNQAFQAAEYIPVQVEPRRVGDAISRRNIWFVGLLGLVGCGLWLMTYDFSYDMGPLLVGKEQAIKVATDAVQKEFGVDVSKEWQPTATVNDDGASTQSRFIWQVYGKDAYQQMQGSYLKGVIWFVRFVQFNRPVEDRGEEYQVIISNHCAINHDLKHDASPIILAIEHMLPEHYQGADISEEQALDIAHRFIEKKFGLTESQTELISVTNDKLENRRNWTMVMQDLNFFDFAKEGQARIELVISGDVVTSYTRFIFVPEDWSRADRSHLMNINVFKTGLYFLMILFILIGFMFGIQRLLVSQYGTKIMRHKGIFMFALLIIVSVNSFCVRIGFFNTAEPYYDQFGRVMLQMIMQNLWQIFFCSILLTVGAVGFIKGNRPKLIRSLVLAGSAGMFMIGLLALIAHCETILQPQSGYWMIASNWSPMIGFCCYLMRTFCLILSMNIAMFAGLKFLQKKWPTQLWAQLVFAIAYCISLESLGISESMIFMLAKGCIVGIVVFTLYRLLLRHDMTLLPLTLAAVVIFDTMPELLYPSYVGAQLHAGCAIMLMMALGIFFYERAHIE